MIKQNIKKYWYRKILNLSIGFFLIFISVIGFTKSYKNNFFGSIIYLIVFFSMGIMFLFDGWVNKSDRTKP